MNHKTSYISTILSILAFNLTVPVHAGIPTGPPPEPLTYGVHSFDCNECHGPFMSLTDDVADVFCLRCHKVGANPVAPPPNGWPPVTKEDGVTPFHDGESDIHFSGDDASNAFGNNPGASLQTSHNWVVGTNMVPAAGASAPLDSRFYSNYGTSLDKITCSRCHLPHEDTDNPKLLAMGSGSADAMCLDCHRSWNQSNNRGWLTHPIVVDYNAVVAANPDKYKAQIDNKAKARLQKVNGGISCMTCHAVHFVDSDASTPDSPYNVAELQPSTGHLLRGDGPGVSDKSSLCQSCHTYAEHGDANGEKVGCLRCHGGHAYNPGSPNYFVLRKSTNTATFGSVSNLNYSSPDVLNNSLTYTFWNDQADGMAEGYCEKCHGDAKSIGLGAGNYHVASAICTDCHSHENQTFVSHGGGGGSECEACHGHDAGYEYEAGKFSEGRGTFQSHSTHTENDLDDLCGPNIGCSDCHDTNSFPDFKTGTDNNGDGKFNLDETDVCNTCHSQGGSYDGVGDALTGAKANWESGIYNGTQLQAGKEKWCATCHDEAPSLIGSTFAPNVIGDEDADYNYSIYSQGYGYYKTGHGLPGSENYPSSGGVVAGGGLECDACHDYSLSHVDDDPRSFDCSDGCDADEYRTTYRLQTVAGNNPMEIPWTGLGGSNATRFRLCAQCHDSGPFTDAANMNTNLVTGGINRHEYHLALSNQNRYPADYDLANYNAAVWNSRIICVTCHNVHGTTQLAMVRDGKLIDREQGLAIWYNSAVTTYPVAPPTADPPEPTYTPLAASTGVVWRPGTSTNLCSHCHFNGNLVTVTRAPFQDVTKTPELSWTKETNYTNDGVNPDSDTGGSEFFFRVQYTDDNNDAPLDIELWIDRNDDGDYDDTGEHVALNEADISDLNYMDGKVYQASVTLDKTGDSILNYRFYATDGSVAVGEPTSDKHVIILNDIAELDWTEEPFFATDGVNPDTGGNGAAYEFRVRYTDRENESPSLIQTWIDIDDSGTYESGEKFTMNDVDAGDTTYSDGKLYSYSTNLSFTGDGTLNYRFHASDGYDDAIGAATDNSSFVIMPGSNNPPHLFWTTAACLIDGVRPGSGAADTEFEFLVNYFDLDDECPSSIQVWIDEDDNLSYDGTEKYDLSEVDGGDTDCSDGKIYKTSRILTLGGDNNFLYRFYASDGTDEALGEAISSSTVKVLDAVSVRPSSSALSYDFTSIINAANAVSGRILVYPNDDYSTATYNENVTLYNKDDRQIMSICGPDLTIISSQVTTNATITAQDSANLVVDGFSITGATSNSGVYVNRVDSTTLTFRNSKIYGNSYGVYINDGDDVPVEFENVEIFNNSTRGIQLVNADDDVNISDSEIHSHSIVGNGAAIAINNGSTVNITRSILRDNTTSASGGAIYANAGSLTIENSMIFGNQAATGGAIGVNSSPTINIINSTIADNQATSQGGGALLLQPGDTNDQKQHLVGQYGGRRHRGWQQLLQGLRWCQRLPDHQFF